MSVNIGLIINLPRPSQIVYNYMGIIILLHKAIDILRCTHDRGVWYEMHDACGHVQKLCLCQRESNYNYSRAVAYNST